MRQHWKPCPSLIVPLTVNKFSNKLAPKVPNIILTKSFALIVSLTPFINKQYFSRDLISFIISFMISYSIAHLNTHCLSSTFNGFLAMLNEYQFEIITMSKTWLKDNQKLLDYIGIPSYKLQYTWHDNKRGGGVGVCIKETFNYKEHALNS